MNRLKTVKSLGIFVFCSLVSFVVIALCCQSSFLYPFNEEIDVSCFFTVARCILNGKVLYKDIYEHKGLYTYLIYALAYLIDNTSYLGAFYIEFICSLVFMLMTYKICKILTDNTQFSMAASLISVVTTYTSGAYQEGGFVEDFSIPLISIVIYLVVRWLYQGVSDRLLLFYFFIIGIITGILFWIKYTMIGCVLGLVVYTLIYFIKQKNIVLLFKCGIICFIGFVISSIPCLVYFYANEALYDMLQVYFYNLLFVYKGGNAANTGNFGRAFIDGESLKWLFNSSGITLLFLVDIISLKKESNEYKKAATFMFITSSVILVKGVIYENCYQPLSLFPFLVFGLVFAWELFIGYKEEVIHFDNSKIVVFIDRYLTKITVGVCLFLAVCQTAGFLGNSFCVIMMLIYFLITQKLGDFVTNYAHSKKYINIEKWGKYILGMLLVILGAFASGGDEIENNLLGVGALLAIVIWLIKDWYIIIDLIQKNKIKLAETITTSFKIRMAILGSILVVFYCLLIGGNLGYFMADFETTPQYKFTKIIKESGIENPLIEGYQVLDIGLFNVLGTLPSTKYYGYYCIELPEIDAEKDEIIRGKKADFIYTDGPHLEDSILSGYKVVASAVPYDVSDGYRVYYLLKKNDI